MPEVKNVSTSKPSVSGAVYRAPLGTELPTSATAALGEAFKGLGYVSEDGLTNATERETVKAWGGDIVASTITDTFQFTLIEAMNVDVIEAVYGEENVSGTAESGIVIKVNETVQNACVWVFDVVLKGGVKKRIVVPHGAVSEVGDVTYNESDPLGYETTITATADDAGQTHYEYIGGSSDGDGV